MAVSYVKFLKHATKMTKAVSEARPILKGVCHYEDGSLAVTDSHRMYFAKNAHESTKQDVKCPVTGNRIEGNYPDVRKLLPSNEQFTVVLNVTETLTAIKAMLLSNKKALIKLSVRDHDLIMEMSAWSLQVTYNSGGLNSKQNHSESKATLNGKYLLELFDFLKDLDLTSVELKYHGLNRPITIGTDDIIAVVLPIRE